MDDTADDSSHKKRQRGNWTTSNSNRRLIGIRIQCLVCERNEWSQITWIRSMLSRYPLISPLHQLCGTTSFRSRSCSSCLALFSSSSWWSSLQTDRGYVVASISWLTLMDETRGKRSRRAALNSVFSWFIIRLSVHCNTPCHSNPTETPTMTTCYMQKWT